MNDTEIVAWCAVPDGAICPDCRGKLTNRKNELDPIFAGTVEEWLSHEDRSLKCVWCHAEIWEPDATYAEQYTILKEGRLCSMFGTNRPDRRFWCVDCQDQAPEGAISKGTLNSQVLLLVTEGKVTCASCDAWVLERAHHLVRQFERDWGNVDDILDRWEKMGIAGEDPTTDWDDSDLDDAIDLIEQNGYQGFSTDNKNWYCVRHSIEVFFDGAFQAVVEFATKKRDDLVTPTGAQVFPWNVGIAISPPDGIFCSVGNCPTEISRPEDWDGNND